MTTAAHRYIAPGRGDRIFNSIVRWLTRRGVSLAGSRVLAVRGRASGEWRTTVVNLLTVDGSQYLVAPRGTTQWVRNLRQAGHGELRLGRSSTPFVARELGDDEKLPILRAYLARWGWEVGRFFDGITRDATDDDLAGIASGFPVFVIQ